MSDFEVVISELNIRIRQQIQAYADKKGISYEEATKRATITVDGTKVKPFADYDSPYEGYCE